MAVCAYVLVIVASTTDINFVLGKGVRLPVVDVQVPIVGFYCLAPYIVLLAHFNLLVQLQLLSRKLYAFDALSPTGEGICSLRVQLHPFPYTHYLVGHTSPIMQMLLSLMVSLTIVLLPLITLLAIQLRFLAYQEESIIWAQRVAIWLDVSLIGII